MAVVATTPRLERLGTADLAAIASHRGVIRHVLRLEMSDSEAAPSEQTAETCDGHRLPNVGAGALEHQDASFHLIAFF
jgi:hypothetical protein